MLSFEKLRELKVGDELRAPSLMPGLTEEQVTLTCTYQGTVHGDAGARFRVQWLGIRIGMIEVDDVDGKLEWMVTP